MAVVSPLSSTVFLSANPNIRFSQGISAGVVTLHGQSWSLVDAYRFVLAVGVLWFLLGRYSGT